MKNQPPPLPRILYNAIFKRTSTLILTIIVGSVILERTLDVVGDAIYFSHNKGKLWKDIKHKYEE